MERGGVVLVSVAISQEVKSGWKNGIMNEPDGANSKLTPTLVPMVSIRPIVLRDSYHAWISQARTESQRQAQQSWNILVTLG